MQEWKQKQRSRLLEERAALTAKLRYDNQKAVLANIEQYLATQRPTSLGIYWPIKAELDCRSLAETLIKQGWQLAVPVINKETKQLDFADWTPETVMVNGIWNIPVPAEPDWIRPKQFLIPLVGFDKQSYRLGYGGGYYDRTLAAIKTPVNKIGVGFEMGRLETIHPHEFDIAMDMIITEQGLHYRAESA